MLALPYDRDLSPAEIEVESICSAIGRKGTDDSLLEGQRDFVTKVLLFIIFMINIDCT